jgi:hypothetical protein
MGMYLVRATPYIFGTLRRFRKIPVNTLKASIVKQIFRITKIVTEIAMANATAHKTGVRIKPNGFVDFSDHLY